MEEAEGGIEAYRFETFGGDGGIWGVCAPGVDVGNQGEAESNPEDAEGGEDDAGKGVTKDPLEKLCQHDVQVSYNDLPYLANAAKIHKNTTEGKIDASAGSSTTASSSPAHEVA